MEQLDQEELDGMRRLATIGTLTHEEIDATTPLEDLDLIHITDVIEMQRLLQLAVTEIERLYLILGATE
jgi:hypothetical protein